MIFNKAFENSRIKNQRGQVAIFVALIFQVLFLFFAMVVNVGLLVHHKINLQNSVDLAAYYGAMKQAENLNAIAHINYQIRQSWKLLSWRYRQLGTAGNFSPAHPFSKQAKDIVATGEQVFPDPTFQPFYDAPAFCITYIPFRPMPAGENTCKELGARKIPLFRPPAITAPFLGLSIAIRQSTMNLLNQATERCRTFGSWNYITLARFVMSYVTDHGQKKMLMRHIAAAMSENQKDFWDLDGNSVSQGILQTLRNNLTVPNKESLRLSDFKVYNSLGSDSCGMRGGTFEPPKWLSEVRIHPAFMYTDTTCNIRAVETLVKPLWQTPTHYGENGNGDAPQELKDFVTFYKTYVGGDPPDPYKIGIGYEKNPWCMAYVGVSAKTRPSIPFAPLGDIELSARAYAKPFGGKIGPWYGRNWPQTSPESQGEKIDSLLPIRANDLASVGDSTLENSVRAANYSKYPGDQFGLKSLLTLGQFGRAIYQIDPKWRTYSYPEKGTLEGLPDPDGAGAPNFQHWNDLGRDFKETGHGDILAWDSYSKWDKEAKVGNLMRQLELVAVAPDLFDISYYSIEPNYYNNYFKRIRDSFLPRKGGYQYLPRSDLGSRIGDQSLESFSVTDQVEVVKKLSTQSGAPIELDKLGYIVTKGTEQLLTSWVGKNLLDYRLDTEALGKCNQRPLAERPTSGDCIGPGRSGYSVKIVSDDYLKDPKHQLGGEGESPGAIVNPPPGKEFWGF